MTPHHSRHSRLLAGVAAVAVAFSLAACSGGSSTPTTEAIDNDPASTIGGAITIMRNDGEITDEIVAQFKEAYPNIEVTLIGDDAFKLKALQAAGTPPDIFRADGPSVPILVSQGQLMDLTTPLEAAGINDSDAFGAAGLYMVDGKRYGIPKDWSPDLTVFVNNTMFEAAGIAIPDPSTPLSFDEIAALAEQLTISSGATTSQFGLGGAWETFSPARILSAGLAESGETLYSSDQTKIELASNPNAVSKLTYMADLAKAGYTHSPLNPSAEWSGSDFIDGTVAMVIYGYWFHGLLASEGITDYTMLPAPYWSDKSARVNPTITGVGYVMSSKAENANAAWAFLKFYLTGDQAAARTKAGFGLPVMKSQIDLLPQATDADLQAFAVVTEEAKISPALQFNKYYNDSVFTDSYNKYLQDYINGSISIEDMTSGIETDVNAAIQDGLSQVQ